LKVTDRCSVYRCITNSVCTVASILTSLYVKDKLIYVGVKLVSHPKGRMLIECFGERSNEKNVRTSREKTTERIKLYSDEFNN